MRAKVLKIPDEKELENIEKELRAVRDDPVNAELQQPRPLQDANVAYERAAAEERQKRDALVATWRDWLHYSMQSPGAVNMIHAVHAVMDSMDTFLNHAGGRRK